jgi:hypothetical protein
MKKIIVILIAFALPLCWWSCEEVLDKVPDGQITIDEVLTDYGRSKGLLDEAYSKVYFKGRDRYISFFATFESLTDNAHQSDVMWSSYRWHSGQLNEVINPLGGQDSDTKLLWADFWRGVRKANLAIKYLPQSTAITADERDRWVAEARVLRCWYYLNLLEFYGPVPWVEEPFEADFAGWNDLMRPTYDYVATKISDELMDVVNTADPRLFPNRRPNREFHRASKGLALAIRARVLLNNASPLNNPDNDLTKWQRAADAAQDVIALPDFELVPMADYKSLFIGEVPAKEVIWWGWEDNAHINNVNGINVSVPPFDGIVSMPNKCGECPTQELVDCFELTNGALPVTYNDATHLNVTVTEGAKKLGYSEAPAAPKPAVPFADPADPTVYDAPYANRDARFYVDILFNNVNYGTPYNCTGELIVETFVGGRNGIRDKNSFGNDVRETNTGYYGRKDRQIEFWGPGALQQNGHKPTHWVLFRLAEFYLNKAEALCETGDLTGAKEALNVVRTRAGQPRIEDAEDYQDSQDNLRARIRNERRVEFCMEGWRFHDQRRWKILHETNRFVTAMRITKSGGMLHYEREKVKDYQSYTDKHLVLPIPTNEIKKMTGMTQPEAWR